jgi:hypothetical protein
LPDRPVQREHRRDEQRKGDQQASHHDRVVEPFDAPERRVVQRRQHAFEGWRRQDGEPEAVEERIKEVRKARKEHRSQQKGRQVHAEHQRQQEHGEVVQAPERREARDQRKRQRQADLAGFSLGVEDVEKFADRPEHPCLPVCARAPPEDPSPG